MSGVLKLRRKTDESGGVEGSQAPISAGGFAKGHRFSQIIEARYVRAR